MKIILTIILTGIIAFSSNMLKSQTREDLINKIMDKVEDIHLDTNLKSITLQNEEFLENMTDGGGELTAFYKKNRIYKIYQSVGISYGVGITEYYYSKDKLMFVREKFNAYNYDSLSFDYSKTTTTFSGFYYFDNDKLIHSTSTGHNRFEGESIDPAKFYLDESAKNIALMRNKMSSK